MTVVYLETSALVKRYVQEVGSDNLEELFVPDSDTIHMAISILSVLELKAAWARLANRGIIKQGDLNDLHRRFRRDRSTFFSLVMSIDNSVFDQAGEVVNRYPLRSLDAIHFAAIERVRDIASKAGERFVAIASDKELLAACREGGVETLNPEEEGAANILRQL